MTSTNIVMSEADKPVKFRDCIIGGGGGGGGGGGEGCIFCYCLPCCFGFKMIAYTLPSGRHVSGNRYDVICFEQPEE